jgi:GntR family transcriptional regulator
VKTGSPLIELVRTVYDRRGSGVEHLCALYRPDRYGFEFELVRSGGARSRGWSPLPIVRRKPARKAGSSAEIAFI